MKRPAARAQKTAEIDDEGAPEAQKPTVTNKKTAGEDQGQEMSASRQAGVGQQTLLVIVCYHQQIRFFSEKI